MSLKQRLIVIGNGMAGARTVEEILARGGRDRFEITVLGDEPHGNYNRIMLSKVLSGNTEANEIMLNPIEWYADNGVTLKTKSRVTAIDRAAKSISTANGETLVYDLLIIATGSRPMLPPIQGMRTEDGKLKTGVFAFRTIEDCVEIAEYARKCKRATVIGGGLLGLECARGLIEHGAETHVIHLGARLMEAQLDRAAGLMLKKSLETMGLHVHLERSTKCILGEDRVEGLTFADGETLDCCMTVVACGIVPNVELARECGLKVNRGILTDDQMRTEDSSIFSVGECVEHRGRVYGLVAPLWHQGQVLADVITGANPNAMYPGSRLATKLKVMGVDLATMGITEPEVDDEVVEFSEARRGRYKKLIIRDGELVGAILLGETEKAATLLQAFDRRSALPEDRASLLFSLENGTAAASIVDAPDDTQVCNCNGVCKGTIVAAVKAGRRNLKMVMESTRAGSGCGSCKGQVQQLVEWAADGEIVEDPSIHYYVPGVPLTKPELIAAIREQELRSVSLVFNALAGGKEDPGSKMGLSSLLKTLWGAEYEDERDARYINDRVHANIQKDRTFSVIPRIYGGVTSADQLRRIADVADKYDVPMVKITGGQRIDLLGIKKDDLPQVWKDLGMPSGHAYAKAFRTCKTCVGTEFCRYGVGDSTGLGIKIENRFQGLESPGKLKLATAGCPRNCSEAYVKDVGAVAIEGGRWEIYVGGAAGAHIRKGDLLATVETHEEVLLYVGRFLQYYRENAKYLERTYGFVERVGIEKIRGVVMNDSEGTAAALDAAMQASVDAYVDPWEEAERPATSHQFSGVMA